MEKTKLDGANFCDKIQVALMEKAPMFVFHNVPPASSTTKHLLKESFFISTKNTNIWTRYVLFVVTHWRAPDSCGNVSGLKNGSGCFPGSNLWLSKLHKP